MKYEIKKFENLIGLNTLSEVMINNHLTLYTGYVNNTNRIIETLAKLEINSPEYNELKRRLGWETNGILLHELYFENLSKSGGVLADDSLLKGEIIKSYGSYDAFLADFRATGMMRGIGWVLTIKDDASEEIRNIWIGEHDIGLPANSRILLVMDVWEHAYMTDFMLKRADYIDAFINSIDWSVIEKRLK